ncbi:MAG: peptide-methionine (S)-S-oxide reductase MsrA [Bacteroidota bacterium]|nr:peptide-methionine (S)-S-oxide reductase MsrA [Bacteroidota bacterium]
MSTIYFGGGCFWCTEAVFQRVIGVEKVTPGYMGGMTKNPTYKEICTGKTGHAEVIKITFEDKIIDFESLLSIFFNTHDPTTINRQSNDIGTQYRSIIFCENQDQLKSADLFVKNLEKERIYNSKIVTEILLANIFYSAEKNHFNYYNENKNQVYCKTIIEPKLKKFMTDFNQKLKTK